MIKIYSHMHIIMHAILFMAVPYIKGIVVHLKTGWLEAHFIGFIGKKRKELSN